MIFSELYSAYYNTVAAVLKAACDHPLQKGELRRIVDRKAFGESVLNIEPALTEERWQLLLRDGTTPIRHAPTMPLTLLQKRWLKAVSLDPRIRLFTDGDLELPDVEPLFTPADICVFDTYLDGDPYADEGYIRHFRLILEAIKTGTPLRIDCVNRRGRVLHPTLMPEYLEYSEKDDKFRVIGYTPDIFMSLLIGTKLDNQPGAEAYKSVFTYIIVFAVIARVLMHFAHFEKQAEKIDQDRYRLFITYDYADETEMVIRILSFGPMVRVTAPDPFVDLIRDRLIRQKNCVQ